MAVSEEMPKRIRQHDPRDVWNTKKTKALAELKKDPYQGTGHRAGKAVRPGAGAALDKWSKEIDKYPNRDLDKLHSARVDVIASVKDCPFKAKKAPLSAKGMMTLTGVRKGIGQAPAAPF